MGLPPEPVAVGIQSKGAHETMKDRTALLCKGVLVAAAVLSILGFLRFSPLFSQARPAAPEAAAHVGVAVQEPLAAGASPTLPPTRPPATATSTPTPTSPPPTPTAVALPAAGPAHALSLGNGSVFDMVQEREQVGRISGWRPTPTPVPTPVSQPPARIMAPSVGLDAPVVPMYWKKVTRGNKVSLQWTVPRNEAGWHFNSALPGQVGNTVLSGHRNIYTEVFRDLDDLKVGDEIALIAGQERYVYHVDEIHVLQEAGVSESVRRQNAQWIAPTDDVRLTLVTCWPYEAPGNTHRLIVVARP